MIYLDYEDATPMSLEAIDTYVKVAKDYIGNVSANNKEGEKSKKLFLETTKELANMFNILDSEIIYTNGGIEANNMALVGVAMENHKRGKHIIVSRLEQSSTYKICDYLASIGFEISYVKNDEEGLISFDDLRNLIREDTILVSICAVNGSVGVRQPLKMLRQIIKKVNEHTIFHSDLTDALGKTIINFRDIDLGSVSADKVYGPKGIGFLYKNSLVKMTPLTYGNNKYPQYKPDNLPLPLIVSMKEAIKNSIKELDKKERYINLLNERIVSKLSNIDGIKINKTKYSIPHILNISFDKISSETVCNTLGNKDILVSCNSKEEISSAVMAIYNDLERSKRTLRISLSHLTTVLEINRFLEIFLVEYNNLINLIGG